MKMKLESNSVLAVIGVLIIVWSFSCTASPFTSMVPAHAKRLQNWLELNKEYRLATIEDCNCQDYLEQLRRGDGQVRKPQPTYQPHYAVGDFNGDGIPDFAVIVRPITTEKGALVLVFLGKRKSGYAVPIRYPIPDPSIENYGLFADRPSKGRERLFVGLFASEEEEVPIPNAIK